MRKEYVVIRMADHADLKYLTVVQPLPGERVVEKIKNEEVFLLVVGGTPVGQLWLEFLWSLVPYIALIKIEEQHRKKGYSRKLLGFCEDFLRGKGHEVLYSSSQMDEPAPQAWHRHMGFEECGAINGINQGGVGEVFFRKKLV